MMISKGSSNIKKKNKQTSNYFCVWHQKQVVRPNNIVTTYHLPLADSANLWKTT